MFFRRNKKVKTRTLQKYFETKISINIFRKFILFIKSFNIYFIENIKYFLVNKNHIDLSDKSKKYFKMKDKSFITETSLYSPSRFYM